MANLHSKRINGRLVWYDAENPQRWLAVTGLDVTELDENFVEWNVDNTTGLPTAYTSTLVNGSTAALTPAAGGAMLMTSDTAEDDGIQIQLMGESWLLDDEYPAYCGCKFKLVDADQTDFLFGLCVTDTTLLGGMTDGIYAQTVDATAALTLEIEKDSTATSAALATLVDNTYIIIEFYFDGTNIDWWVNGVQATRPAITNLPDDEELTPSIAMLTGEAIANTATIAWFRAFQIR